METLLELNILLLLQILELEQVFNESTLFELQPTTPIRYMGMSIPFSIFSISIDRDSSITSILLFLIGSHNHLYRRQQQQLSLELLLLLPTLPLHEVNRWGTYALSNQTGILASQKTSSIT